MEKISELISRLCPEGVGHKLIKEVFTRLKGTPITAGIMKDIQNSEGDVVIFAGGKTIITAFEKDIPNANIISRPSVIVQSRGIIDVQYSETPFTFKNEMWAYTNDNKDSVKFLYYYLKQNVEILRKKGSEHGSMPQISLSATEDLEIPFPPYSIQQEIVRILDSFSQLQSNLEDELAARQKQYEFYREEFLKFNKDECPMQKVSNFSSVLRGKRLTKNMLSDSNTYPVYHGGNEPIGYYTEYNRPARTVMVINVGASAGTVGFCDKEFWSSDGCFCLKKNEGVDDKFLYYSLKVSENEIMSKVRTAGIPTLDNKVVENIVLPIPSLEIQQEIVSTLNTFESLIANIKQEIEARKKQYEYYREKLLAF